MVSKELKKEIFLKKGELRRLVYDALDKPKTATELKKELGDKHRSSISRTLIQLEKVGLIKCVNPEDDKFRHYVKR
jgi:DNA-binding HxlR family transcriptional regulator